MTYTNYDHIDVEEGNEFTGPVSARWRSDNPASIAACFWVGAKVWVPSFLLRSPPRPSNCFNNSPHRLTARAWMRSVCLR